MKDTAIVKLLLPKKTEMEKDERKRWYVTKLRLARKTRKQAYYCHMYIDKLCEVARKQQKGGLASNVVDAKLNLPPKRVTFLNEPRATRILPEIELLYILKDLYFCEFHLVNGDQRQRAGRDGFNRLCWFLALYQASQVFTIS